MPEFTNADLEIRPYEPFTLGLSGCDDGCTIAIQDGDSDDPEDVKLLTKNAKGSFRYLLLPDELPSGIFVFKLTDNDSGEIDYSAEWEWDGESAPTSIPSGSLDSVLGLGALAGIVAGVVAAMLLILAGAWLCLRRRRRDTTSHGPTSNSHGRNSLESISELGEAKECQVQVIPACDMPSPPPAYTAQDEMDSNQLPDQPPLALQTQSWKHPEYCPAHVTCSSVAGGSGCARQGVSDGQVRSVGGSEAAD
ncbi:hypothetical protein ACJZ2D_015238 [Fusarium nematophilum]